jgi:hypothetical protein
MNAEFFALVPRRRGTPLQTELSKEQEDEI